MELSLRLVGKSYDPFQQDLEWFEYEIAVGAFQEDTPEGPLASDQGAASRPRRLAVEGKLSRKDFNELLRQLDGLIGHDRSMRFEPYDLNFYLEWSHETPQVYLVVTWFDLALTPRGFDQRFPSCHAGFRFLADSNALSGFRRALEDEFRGTAPTAPPGRLSTRVN